MKAKKKTTKKCGGVCETAVSKNAKSRHIDLSKNKHCKKQLARLKKIEGQVRGLQQMLEEDRYCIDIITQTSAVRNALRSFEDAILENHLQTCAMRQMQSSKKSENQKAVEEILKVYKLKK